MHVSEDASEASSVAIFEAGYNSAASISYDLLPDATAHRPEEYRCSEHADTGPGARATWKDASPVRDDPVVIYLVTRARAVDGAEMVIGHLPAGLEPGGLGQLRVPAIKQNLNVSRVSQSQHVTARPESGR